MKRRHDLDDLKRRKQAQEDDKAKSKRKKQQKQVYVKKPNTILAQAKSRRNEEARYRRVKKKGMMKRASNKPVMETKEFKIDEEKTKTINYQANSVGAPMVFVIRTREDAGRPPKLIFDTLARFRLREPFQGVFLKYNPATRKMLHLVEPWVLYGKPSEGVVKDLLERRSFGTVKGKRVPISDNVILEQELGAHNIICMEDLVHELVTVGDAFDAAARFLWPFSFF